MENYILTKPQIYSFRLLTATAHRNIVNCLESPDGHRIITVAGAPGSVFHLYDLQSGECLVMADVAISRIPGAVCPVYDSFMEIVQKGQLIAIEDFAAKALLRRAVTEQQTFETKSYAEEDSLLSVGIGSVSSSTMSSSQLANDANKIARMVSNSMKKEDTPVRELDKDKQDLPIAIKVMKQALALGVEESTLRLGPPALPSHATSLELLSLRIHQLGWEEASARLAKERVDFRKIWEIVLRDSYFVTSWTSWYGNDAPFAREVYTDGQSFWFKLDHQCGITYCQTTGKVMLQYLSPHKERFHRPVTQVGTGNPIWVYWEPSEKLDARLSDCYIRLVYRGDAGRQKL